MLAQSGERQRSGKRRLREGKRGRQRTGIAREGFLDRRSKRCFWLLLSPQTKVARAGARNYPRRRQIMRLRRCAATPHPSRLRRATCLPAGRSVRGSDTPPACHSTPRTPQGEGLRGASFNGAKPSRGRLLGCGIQHRGPLKGKADACGRGTKKGPAGPVLLCFFGLCGSLRFAL